MARIPTTKELKTQRLHTASANHRKRVEFKKAGKAEFTPISAGVIPQDVWDKQFKNTLQEGK